MPTIPRHTGRKIIERQTANRVNPDLIADAGATAGAFAAVAGAGADIAEKMYIADQKTQLNQQVLTAQKDIFDIDQTLKQEFKNNPSGYMKELDSRLKEYYKTTGDQFSDPQTKNLYMQSAQQASLQYYKSGTAWAQNRQVSIYGERIADAKDQNDILAYRAAQAGQPIDQVLRNAKASKVAGSEVIASEKLQNVTEEMQSSATKMYLQGLIDQGKIAQAKEMIDSKEYDEALGAAGLASMIHATNKAQNTINNTKISDRALYEMQINGATTTQEIAQGQLDAGVPPEAVVILPNDEAKALVDSFEKIGSKQQLVLMHDRLKEDYGSEYTPNVLNDLTRAGLPPQMQFMMQMDTKEDERQMEAMFNVFKDAKGARDLARANLSLDNVSDTDFKLALRERRDDLFSVLSAEGKSAGSLASIDQNLLDLAYTHYSKVRDVDAAVEFAVDWIDSKSHTANVNGFDFRVLKSAQADPHKVEHGARVAFKRADIRVQSGRGPKVDELAGLQAKDTARWALNYAGNGLMLVDSLGIPLVSKDGNMIDLTYEQLEDVAQEAFEQGEIEKLDSSQEALERIKRAEESSYLFPNKGR